MLEFTDVPISSMESRATVTSTTHGVCSGLCQRSVADVCLKDRIFPKTNSLLRDSQELY
jgi:hypothetical protein